ncbi:major capsid protein [Psychrobacter sp. JB385]|uniref:major capsid protein n=1 Tax=Psychrobacter sp. JB385 TaxID=1434841 RepID=UPI00097EF747|nr:major capsid protein [Psychrobacter sp. JB385]SJN27198.1 hypothetical protein CZ794_05720 [Psychrobacter sp. JB385]
MKLYRWFVGLAVALYAMLAPVLAQAEAIDVTNIIGEIDGNKAPMMSTGTAMLGLTVLVVLIGMVRRVLK